MYSLHCLKLKNLFFFPDFDYGFWKRKKAFNASENSVHDSYGKLISTNLNVVPVNPLSERNLSRTSMSLPIALVFYQGLIYTVAILSRETEKSSNEAPSKGR